MTRLPDHGHYQQMLGAYILGALDTDDRVAVDEHATRCDECRRELAEFSVIPGLLAKAPDIDQSTAATIPVNPTAALQGAVASLTAARRTRRRLAAAGVAAVAACSLAAGVGIGVVSTPDAGQIAAQRTVSLSGEAGRMGGSAELTSRPWGTEMRLALHGLPPEQRLVVVTVGPNGRVESAGAWSVPAAGRITLTGATSMQPNNVVRIEVRNDKGAVLAASAD